MSPSPGFVDCQIIGWHTNVDMIFSNDSSTLGPGLILNVLQSECTTRSKRMVPAVCLTLAVVAGFVCNHSAVDLSVATKCSPNGCMGDD